MSRQALQEYLSEKGIAGGIITFPGSVRSVAEAAKQAGLRHGELIKTIILLAGESSLACIIPGDRRLDLKKARALAGTGQVEIAKPDQVQATTGYPVGGVPPVFSGAEKIPFFIDRSLLARERVTGGGGDASSLMRIAPSEIVRATGAKAADLCQV